MGAKTSAQAAYPATGRIRCYDTRGGGIPCAGSGRDGEGRRGRPWPAPRFAPHPWGTEDRLTGPMWHPDTDLTGGPTDWDGAPAAVAERNGGPTGPWRLPKIIELEPLTDCDRRHPALPAGAPFAAPREAYWSSTTSTYEPDRAWALYPDTGAVGVGRKRGRRFHAWALRDADRGRW